MPLSEINEPIRVLPRSRRRYISKNKRLGLQLLVLWLPNFAMTTTAFTLVPTSHSTASHLEWNTMMLHAKANRKGKQVAAVGGKKTKKTDNNKKNKSSKPSAAQPSQSSSPLQKSTPSKSSSNKTPPWQVLSAKDAKVNIEKEKVRRQHAREGDHTVSIMSNDQEDGTATKTLSTVFLSEAEQKFLNWRRFNPSSAPGGMHFVGSHLESKRLPPSLGVPEVAFLGRSNVGKSSLLNRLSAFAGQRDQARVGKTPGATASVNLYALVDAKGRELLGWADLPGFGYAKLSKTQKEAVQAAAEHYLDKRRELCLGILLVDIRREPSEDDRAVLAALYDLGVPLVVVATKIDKVSNNQLPHCLETIRDGLGLPEGQPLAISSTTGEGTRDLWKIILEACEEGVRTKKLKYDEETQKRQGEEREEDFDEDDFVDDDDVVYSQGYDWIHGDSMYAEDDFGEDEYDDEAERDTWWDQFEKMEDEIKPQRETLKSLQQRSREMEKRGEL